MSTTPRRRSLSDDSDDAGSLGPVTHRPCTFCGKATLIATLANYGARCNACYEAFCREPQPHVDVGDKRLDPRSWAHALKRRHEAGERLTPPQIAMYRAALSSQQRNDEDETPADRARAERAKRETQKRVDAYLQEHGR